MPQNSVRFSFAFPGDDETKEDLALVMGKSKEECS